MPRSFTPQISKITPVFCFVMFMFFLVLVVCFFFFVFFFVFCCLFFVWFVLFFVGGFFFSGVGLQGSLISQISPPQHEKKTIKRFEIKMLNLILSVKRKHLDLFF